MACPLDDRAFIAHMRDAVARVRDYTAGLDEAAFRAAPLVQDAVVHRLRVMGEAADRVSPETRQRAPDVPWDDLVAMRDRLVHDYMALDLTAVWETAVREIPGLAAPLDGLLGEVS